MDDKGNHQQQYTVGRMLYIITVVDRLLVYGGIMVDGDLKWERDKSTVGKGYYWLAAGK